MSAVGDRIQYRYDIAMTLLFRYLKIPIISPQLIFVQKAFWWVCFREGLFWVVGWGGGGGRTGVKGVIITILRFGQ